MQKASFDDHLITITPCFSTLQLLLCLNCYAATFLPTQQPLCRYAVAFAVTCAATGAK